MTYIEVDNPTHADLHLSPVLLSRSRNGFSYVVNKPVISMSAHCFVTACILGWNIACSILKMRQM